jgi:hypothetical protein
MSGVAKLQRYYFTIPPLKKVGLLVPEKTAIATDKGDGEETNHYWLLTIDSSPMPNNKFFYIFCKIEI